MAISKEKKRDIVAKLNDAFSEASSIAFVGFTKLTVKDSSRFRTELADKDVRLFVAKKTLIRRALGERGYQGILPELPGEVAVAWTKGVETTAPARGVFDFGKKLKGALSLLGGVFEGVFLDASTMTAIATTATNTGRTPKPPSSASPNRTPGFGKSRSACGISRWTWCFTALSVWSATSINRSRRKVGRTRRIGRTSASTAAIYGGPTT